MKKINSIIMAACVAALGFFSSCDPKEEDVMTVNVEVNQETKEVTLTSEFIKTAVLKEVDGDTKTDISATYKTQLDALIKNGIVRFTLPEGNYELTVTDKDTKEIVKTFIVGGGTTEPIDYNLTQFTAVANDVYAYEYDGEEKGTFTIASVTKENGDAGYEVVFSNGLTATLGYTSPAKSFLGANGATYSSAEAVTNNANLLLYLDGKTNTIKAGQLAVFKGADGVAGTADDIANTAKTTKFAKL